jgi:predicted transposase YbfD/YdcC
VGPAVRSSAHYLLKLSHSAAKGAAPCREIVEHRKLVLRVGHHGETTQVECRKLGPRRSQALNPQLAGPPLHGHRLVGDTFTPHQHLPDGPHRVGVVAAPGHEREQLAQAGAVPGQDTKALLLGGGAANLQQRHFVEPLCLDRRFKGLDEIARPAERDGQAVKALTVHIPGGIAFPHAEQAVRITRTRTVKGHTTRETAYLVISLSADHAQPAQLQEWARLEWHIENRLHWVRDVTLREDAHQARTGNGPAVAAVLRNTAIGYHRSNGEPNIARATRRANHHPNDLIDTVTRNYTTTQ